ncbi:MAG: cache domain-containing protein [Alphaproteobacteria bacterium]|nr:MAG: cache domain-containing protein [Alphaproteobacteria bacterium]
MRMYSALHIPRMICRILVLSFCGLLALGGAAWAAQPKAEDRAKALAERAAIYLLKAHGPEKAMGMFSDAKGPFVEGNLYVFAINADGVILAHGTQPILIKRSIMDMQDTTGKMFGREIMAIQDRGWVHYKWLNPTTHTFDDKASYIIRIDGYRIGVGAYTH